MQSITLEEAQARLPGLVDLLKPGEEIVLTRNNQPVARLVGETASSRKPRQPGSAIGQLIIVQEDDEHLEDFPSGIS